MRFVPIKTDEQLDMQSLHRVREALGDASHGSHQPNSWIAARTRHNSTKGDTTCSRFTADPGRRDANLSGAVRLLLTN